MKAVRRTRVRLAAAGLAAPLLVVLTGQAAAAPRPASGGVAVTVGCGRSAGCGVLVVVCGRDGRVTDVVRLAGTPPLLPLGRLTVRIGDPCRPPAAPAPPPPVTVTPTTPPTAAPTTAPPPTGSPTTTAAGPAAPAPSAPPPSPAPGASTAPAAGTSPHPAVFSPAVAGPAAGARPAPGSSAPHPPGPAGTAGYTPPPLADEPYDRGSGDAARWWLMTMAVVLLPAVLAALPYRHIRRRC